MTVCVVEYNFLLLFEKVNNTNRKKDQLNIKIRFYIKKRLLQSLLLTVLELLIH